MNIKDTTGTCQLCGVELGPKEMTNHLSSCVEEYRFEVGRDDERGDNAYHLAVHSKRAPMFWLHLLVRADAHLSHLDAFLRDVWMEERSKHSRFVIGSSIFSSDPSTPATPSNLQGDLSVPLGDVLESEAPFEYAYDLEQTTELEARVVAHRNVLPDQEQTPVRLLARNGLPAIPCECGADAEYLCPVCAEGPSGWLCPSCADEHECSSPVDPAKIQNTPRAIVQVGV